MITVIHGDDIAKSRTYYLQERQKYPEKITLEGNSLTLTDFLQAVSNTGLFGDQQTIFVEELISKRKPSKELDAILFALAHQTAPIFLFESKELTPKQLKPLPSATVKQFSVPKTVFAFLDSLTPGNGKKSFVLFHQLLHDQDVAFALFMLQRQIRILLALHPQFQKQDAPSQTISEVSRLAPWQKGKVLKQAKAFSQDRLLELHKKLYQIELAHKTGQLPQPLDQTIDFLLLTL